MREQTTSRAGWVLLHAVVILGALAMLFPFIWTFITSITPGAGFSITPRLWPDNPSFQAYETLFTERRPRMTLTLSTGPEVHLAPLSGAFIQPRVALRGGVQFGTFDSFGGAEACDAGAKNGNGQGCTAKCEVQDGYTCTQQATGPTTGRPRPRRGSRRGRSPRPA